MLSLSFRFFILHIIAECDMWFKISILKLRYLTRPGLLLPIPHPPISEETQDRHTVPVLIWKLLDIFASNEGNSPLSGLIVPHKIFSFYSLTFYRVLFLPNFLFLGVFEWLFPCQLFNFFDKKSPLAYVSLKRT